MLLTFSPYFKEAIKILPYYGSNHQGLLKWKFKRVKDLASPLFNSPEMDLNLLWQAAWFLTSK